MRVSGRRGHTREVPGTCNIGKMGVTFDYPQVRRRVGAEGAVVCGPDLGEIAPACAAAFQKMCVHTTGSCSTYHLPRFGPY